MYLQLPEGPMKQHKPLRREWAPLSLLLCRSGTLVDFNKALCDGTAKRLTAGQLKVRVGPRAWDPVSSSFQGIPPLSGFSLHPF